MICPLGINAKEAWNNLIEGRTGICGITNFDASNCSSRMGGQLPGDYLQFERERTPKRMFKQTNLSARMVRLAAQEAIEDSQINFPNADPMRCGVIIGSTGHAIRHKGESGDPSARTFAIVRTMVNALSAWISLEFGFKGPSFTVSASCCSGSLAITKACDLIRIGVLDVAAAGGVDNFLTLLNIKRGNALKLLSEENHNPSRAMKPFDRTRNGFVLSDGAGVVILESYEHAVKRRARPYAWIAGHAFVSNSGSNQPVSANGDAMAETLQAALIHSGIPAQGIGHVNANGISHQQYDRMETSAIKKVFGRYAYDLSISANKSMLGHTMGASGALEFAATALSLNSQVVPPTVNYRQPDPECDLNYTPNSMVKLSNLKAAVTNSFGLDGHNCAIVLTRSPDD